MSDATGPRSPDDHHAACEPDRGEPASAADSRVEHDVAVENARWVSGLDPDSADYDHTVAKLYGILLKMAYAETRRKGSRIKIDGPELDDISHQAAADATMTICRKVATFRGDSRFTTWAYKFVAYDVSSKVNRHFWQRAHVSIEDNDWAFWHSDKTDTPEWLAENNELREAVQRIIRETLTDRQRRAFEAITIHGLPVRQVALEMNSNPNAIYKTMFDARKKLRDGLITAGFLSAHLT